MDLATPAAPVEPATAAVPEGVEAATADDVLATEAATVDAPRPVAPAVPWKSPPPPTAPDAAVKNAKAIDNNSNPLSVATLRGTQGADFESAVAILRGAPTKNCLQKLLPCIFDERDFVSYGEVRKYCLIKGTSCFVFLTPTDLQPLYAMELSDYSPVREDPARPDPTSITISPAVNTNQPRDEMVTILLKDRTSGSQAYQFTFDTGNDPHLADQFLHLVERIAAAQAKSTAAVTASAIDAESVGQEKHTKFQPKT